MGSRTRMAPRHATKKRRAPRSWIKTRRAKNEVRQKRILGGSCTGIFRRGLYFIDNFSTSFFQKKTPSRRACFRKKAHKKTKQMYRRAFFTKTPRFDELVLEKKLV